MIDIEDVLARGGAGRIALLRYCVMSVQMEPLFVFLAQEYRLRPTHAGALALYDVFCAPQAPARLAAYELLPPRALALAAAASRMREQSTTIDAPATDDSDETRTIIPPARDLFDALVRGVRSDAGARLARLGAAFDPLLTPQENLPGGTMSAGQRRFVDHVWQPIAKQHLTAAGFWQIATIG